jgi:hypothetical protein
VQKREEPARIIKTDAITIIESGLPNGRVANKYKVGGNDDGGSYRMDYDSLSQSSTSPEDEMRLLGNGVSPQAAEIAFKIGLKDIMSRRK